MLKIVFALSSFYPDHRAGTETYVLNLAKELVELGYRVSVVFPAVGKPSTEYIYEGIQVFSFSVPLKVSTHELNGLAASSGLNEFKKILNKIKPDIFHLHSLSRSLHAEHIKVASKMGVKTVFTGHLGSTFCVTGDLLLFSNEPCNAHIENQRCLSCFIFKKKNHKIQTSKLIALFANGIMNTVLKEKFPAFNIVKNKSYQFSLLKRFCNHNVAIAAWIEKAYLINGLENVSIITQGVDKYFISTNRVSKTNKSVNIIFVGRMHPDKGVHLVIKALEGLSEPNINLTIVTIPFADEMGYYYDIKKRFEKMGFTSWYENLSKEDVAKNIEFADILVLPSTKNEAAPLVILEAFAKKVPVIGSDYIAIKEKINHNLNGLLFKNGDVQSLKEQLQRLMDEPRLIDQLSNNIEEVSTFEEVAREHDEVYKELLIDHPGF